MIVTSDVLRWAIFFLSAVDIGFTLAIFMRIGHFLIPHVQMRTLMFGSMLLEAAVMIAALEHFGDPQGNWGWRIPAFAIGLLLKAVALGSLFHWYGTPDGRSHVKRMHDSIDEHRRAV